MIQRIYATACLPAYTSSYIIDNIVLKVRVESGYHLKIYLHLQSGMFVSMKYERLIQE